MVERYAKLLLQLAVGRCRMRDQRIEVPSFSHPTSGDGVDHAACNFGGVGQLSATNERHVLARLLKSPCEEATCEACADDYMFLGAHGCLLRKRKYRKPWKLKSRDGRFLSDSLL